MAKDYRQLWEVAAGANNEAQAVQTLSNILADEEGRAFISGLDSERAESCVKILDNVSRDTYPPHLPPLHTVSLGCCRARPQTCREAGLLHYLEKTR